MIVLCFAGVAVGSLAISAQVLDEPAHLDGESCGASPDMVRIEGGRFTMGGGAIYPEETPAVVTEVGSFFMSRYEVTNTEFTAFVEETGYVTVAERPPDPALYPGVPADALVPGSVVFVGLSESSAGRGRWEYRAGASWRHPFGPGSSIEGKGAYPVVHVALEDAEAYAAWKGHRLPTEAEHEYASLGGLSGDDFPARPTPRVGDKPIANTWQGIFPFQNSREDGFEGVAPVGCYTSNAYGLYDLIGNVWEWTRSVYYPRHFTPERMPANLPEQGFDTRQPGVAVGVIKGGSFLCSENYCMRYRPAGRHAQDISLGTSHIGFRTVRDVGQ